MFNIAPVSAGLIQADNGRLTECYRLTRVDGTVITLTSHDRPLTVNGVTYDPMDSVDLSALRKEAGVKPQNADARGIISSSVIKSDDLRAGKYSDCKVEELVVDWLHPYAGPIVSNTFWVGKVVFDGYVWTAELDSLPRLLLTKVGDRYTRNCRYRLGDAGCGLNLASLTTTGSVAGMLDGAGSRIIRASGIAPQSDGYYEWGILTFTSGANNGESGEVKTYVASTLDITLQLQLPYRAAIGDTFSLTAGCNRLKTTCKTKFSNVVNFGGYPYVPTTDRVLRVTPR